MNHWGHHKQSQTHTSTYLTLSAIALGGFNFSNYCLVQQGDNSSAKGLLLLWHCSGWDSLIDLSNPAALTAVYLLYGPTSNHLLRSWTADNSGGTIAMNG